MPLKEIYMITGLGNPGRDYLRTRHNMGFLAVDELARRHGLAFSRSRFDSEMVKGRIDGADILLVKPCSYMNRSGFPVRKISDYYNIDPSNIIVLHDDLDLPFGRLMVVKGRGHGGHNGIRSIIEMLGTRDFIRVRAGIGHPDESCDKSRDVTGHVLGNFSKEEIGSLDGFIAGTADACELIISKGVVSAMNSVNQSQ
ncbi:MAG: aminoacyl-tRNA hydrolase [Desulfamplus sp.]|nr:aminoacyl-tRNA hydrolase [Desulfamplus sp.]